MFWIVVLEKTFESPLDCKEIKSVNPKGNQLWIFTGRTDAEAETPIPWSPDAKNWLNGKDPDAGKDWRQEEKGTTEDEIIGCHHRLDGYEFEQAPGVGDGQGSLVCWSPCSHKESDTIEQLKVCIARRITVHLSFLYSTCQVKSAIFQGKFIFKKPVKKNIQLWNLRQVTLKKQIPRLGHDSIHITFYPLTVFFFVVLFFVFAGFSPYPWFLHITASRESVWHGFLFSSTFTP